jgi:mitochondrial chaperone BCS1
MCRVGFRPFIFTRQEIPKPEGQRGPSVATYTITLTTPGWGLKPLQNFVNVCHDFKVRNSGETTTIYFSVGRDYGGYGGGFRSVTRAVRKFDTIDIDEQVKQDLIMDAEECRRHPSRLHILVLIKIS